MAAAGVDCGCESGKSRVSPRSRTGSAVRWIAGLTEWEKLWSTVECEVEGGALAAGAGSGNFEVSAGDDGCDIATFRVSMGADGCDASGGVVTASRIGGCVACAGVKVASALREVSNDDGRSENAMRFASAGGSDGVFGVATEDGVNVGVGVGLGVALGSLRVGAGFGIVLDTGVTKVAVDDAGSVTACIAAGARFHSGVASPFGASVDVDIVAAGIIDAVGVVARSLGRSPLFEEVAGVRGVVAAAELAASDFIALALPSSSSKSFAAVTFCG